MSLLSWVEKAYRGVETYSKYALLGLVQQAKLNEVLNDSGSVNTVFCVNNKTQNKVVTG